MVKELITLIQDLPESEYHIHKDKKEVVVTSEWLVGTFAGRGFSSPDVNTSALKLINYFNKEALHPNTIVGRELQKSGWPDLKLVRKYCENKINNE